MTNTQEVLPESFRGNSPRLPFGMKTNGPAPQIFRSLQELALSGDPNYQPPPELLGSRELLGPKTFCLFDTKDVVQTFRYGLKLEKTGHTSTWLVPTSTPNRFRRYTHVAVRSRFELIREIEGLPPVGEGGLWELSIFEGDEKSLRQCERVINLITGDEKTYRLD